MSSYPILYSFRRCPYAMRARMALYVSGQTCELREVVLRNKPTEMLEIAPNETVPVLLLENGEVLDQSLDIMLWSLRKNDPSGWLDPKDGVLNEMLALIEETDGDFKLNLDHYKYAPRRQNGDPKIYRKRGEIFVQTLNARLENNEYLLGKKPILADYAILPFVRQFANTDRNWFDSLPYPQLQKWMEVLLTGGLFFAVMNKYPAWKSGDIPTYFGKKL
jgi:glutathione S-transferase